MSERKKVVIVGAESMIGGELSRLFSAHGWLVIETVRHPKSSGQFQLVLSEHPVEVTEYSDCDAAVICAGITSLEQCQHHPNETALINVDATVNFIKALGEIGVPSIFLSSNLVFNGLGAHVAEGTPVDPSSEYGRQKAQVEAIFSEHGTEGAVLRLTKVLGYQYALFDGWLAELERGNVIHPISDMVFAPVSLAMATDAIFRILEMTARGIFHLSASTDISYADAATYMAQRMGYAENLIQPISRAKAGHIPAIAPLNTTLHMGRSLDVLQIIQPDPYLSLEAYIDRAGTETGERGQVS